MAQQDWKDRLGVVYSTNPDFEYQTAQDAPEADTLALEKQRLVVRIDRIVLDMEQASADILAFMSRWNRRADDTAEEKNAD